MTGANLGETGVTIAHRPYRRESSLLSPFETLEQTVSPNQGVSGSGPRSVQTPEGQVEVDNVAEEVMAATVVDWGSIGKAREEAARGGGLVLRDIPDAATALALIRNQRLEGPCS